MILAAVNGIHDVSGLPYDFDEPKSGEPRTACHAVAERLGMPFTTVRTIWRIESKTASGTEHGSSGWSHLHVQGSGDDLKRPKRLTIV